MDRHANILSIPRGTISNYVFSMQVGFLGFSLCKRFLHFCGSNVVIISPLFLFDRYEAGLLTKQMCLKDLALGDVLQILNLLITVKKWIAPHQSGWQPIKITLPEIISAGSSVKSDDDGSWLE